MIVLITMTGARPEQFALCQRWMQRQTYTGEVVWIIVDDANPHTTGGVTHNFKENWITEKIFPVPVWRPGMNTQGRNIIAGLDLTENKYPDAECIFIIEDDDYYRPIYLERMMANLQSYDVIGEQRTIYYNVFYQRYIRNANTIHASLFQTAFTPKMIPLMRKCHSHRFIDAEFWKLATNKHLFRENDLAIGMKGMPGRQGIGAGHSRAMNMQFDTNMKFLTSLIGDDALQYKRHYGNRGNARYDILSRKSNR